MANYTLAEKLCDINLLAGAALQRGCRCTACCTLPALIHKVCRQHHVPHTDQYMDRQSPLEN